MGAPSHITQTTVGYPVINIGSPEERQQSLRNIYNGIKLAEAEIKTATRRIREMKRARFMLEQLEVANQALSGVLSPDDLLRHYRNAYTNQPETAEPGDLDLITGLRELRPATPGDDEDQEVQREYRPRKYPKTEPRDSEDGYR